jgi:hypothetical protein
MQRSGHDKVRGRGRSTVAPIQGLLARVLIGQRAVADAGRWAALCHRGGKLDQEGVRINSSAQAMTTKHFLQPLSKNLLPFCATLLLSSCSITGAMILHNASDSELLIERGSRANDKDIVIAPGETKEIQIDPLFGGTHYAFRIGTSRYCFSSPRVDGSWVKAGWKHAVVLAAWSQDRTISLYPPDANMETYYSLPPTSTTVSLS